MGCRPLPAVLVALGVLVAARPARADEQSDLDKARNAYLAQRYDDAAGRCDTMLGSKDGALKDPSLLRQAEMLCAAVAIARTRTKEANRLFEKILTSDPQFEPDPLSFPSEVLDAFVETRAKLREKLSAVARRQAELAAARRKKIEAERKRKTRYVRELERRATEQRIVVRHRRYVAWIPFGAGQFQNGDTTLGWIFLGAEAALIGTAGAMVPVAYFEERAGDDAYAGDDPSRTATAQAHYDAAGRARVVNAVAMGLFAGTAIAGIVHANARFRSETVEIHRRPLPVVSWRPELAPIVGTQGERGFSLGLHARF